MMRALTDRFLDTISTAQRKTGGIFYTPDHIVRYIVDRTLGGYLREHEAKLSRHDYSAFLRTVKVLDPACGAGAFLVHVFDFLLAEYRRVGTALNDLVPASEYARHILRENIYGVDLNAESVELSKQSLWLRSGINGDMRTELDDTIKCGNSLIEDAAVAGRHAFCWPQQFPEVMGAGGFDVIVGNPPYINARTIPETDKTYLRQHFPQLHGAFDLYVAFLLRGQQLVTEHGRYGWIVPNKFLVADYARRAREQLTRDSRTTVIDVSTLGVFSRVGVYPVILLGQPGKAGPAATANRTARHPTLADRGFRINAGTTGFTAHAIKGLLNEENRGIPFAVSGSVDRYRLDTSSVRYLKDRYTNPHLELGSPVVAASKYRFWQSPKIVIAGLTKRVEAVYVESPLALGVGAYGIYDFAGYEPYAVTAVLNSRFMSEYLGRTFHAKALAGGYLALNKSTIAQLPMVDRDVLARTGLTELSKLLHTHPPADEISQAEQRIDEIVSRLFRTGADHEVVCFPSLSGEAGASRLPIRSAACRRMVTGPADSASARSRPRK
jgi:Eco57I restriction-modification methylase/restriction endonuclease TaqI-like protein